MPHCKSCSAPLPPYSGICDYCGVKNDVNLKGIHEFSIEGQFGERKCPVCSLPMETVALEGIDGLAIERCGRCMGLFFDPEELSVLLEKSVKNVYSVNMKRLWNMNQISTAEQNRPMYIKCPVCGDLMNRINFGSRSGVIIDQCKHGIWLDNGELRRLLEWRKAGGQLLHEQVQKEKAAREKKKQQKRNRASESAEMVFTSNNYRHMYSSAHSDDPGALLVSAAKVIWRLFT